MCILQGPVTVKHPVVKDEPIKDLLGNITFLLAQKLLHRLYGGDESKVPTVDYLGAKAAALPGDIASTLGVQHTMLEQEIVYTIGSNIPDPSLWLETLAGPRLDWLRALLISPIIVQGSAYIDNPIRRLFSPRKDQRAVITLKDSLPVSIALYGAARSHGTHNVDFKAVEAKYDFLE